MKCLFWSSAHFLSRLFVLMLLLLLLSRFSRVDSVWPQRRQPTRLPRPWDSPGKNTGVSCHFLLQCMKVKSESQVAQLCPTLREPMDCSLPGSSIHGIFQARVLEWGAIAFSVPSLSFCQRKGIWSPLDISVKGKVDWLCLRHLSRPEVHYIAWRISQVSHKVFSLYSSDPVNTKFHW